MTDIHEEVDLTAPELQAKHAYLATEWLEGAGHMDLAAVRRSLILGAQGLPHA